MKWVRLQWDRCGAWALIGAGTIALSIGWFGVSSSPYPAEQLPYILSGGIVGLFLLGIGAMLWLSADLRDEWHKLDRLEQTLRESRAPEAEPTEPTRREPAKRQRAKGPR